jgi:hypothetical protein
MILSLLEDFVRLLFRLFGPVLLWVVLFPAVWIVSLPVILILSLFDQRPYFIAASGRMKAVHEWWSEWGLILTP